MFGDIVNNTHESLGFRDIVTVDDDSDNDDNELLCEMVDRWKALNLISSRDHCTRFGRSSRPEVFFKEAVLKILENSQENTCAKASFLIKVTDLGQCKNEVVQQW